MAVAAAASSVHEGVVVAANELGTHTDTIATMAGALLGACGPPAGPPEEPLDSDYLVREADRLAAQAAGEEVGRRPEVRSSKSGNALVPRPAGATMSRREPAGGSPADTPDRSRTGTFTSADLQSALTFARKWINHDDALGHTVRRVAEEGTLADLVALVTELRDDLRR